MTGVFQCVPLHRRLLHVDRVGVAARIEHAVLEAAV
jgi:hypothetical protein